MFAKPSFPAVLLLFAGLVLTLLIAVRPDPMSLWEDVDPHAHARYVLRHTSYFSGPLVAHSDTSAEQQARAFRTVARSSAAAAEFRLLADSATTAGRLWALAGLTLVDSSAAKHVLHTLTARTDSVNFIRACERVVRLPVRELAVLAADRNFALTLRDQTPSCGPFLLERTG